MRNATEISGKIGKVSEQLKQKRATGQAGGGMVEVEVNGLGQVLRITIDPALVANNELDMIQDLLPAAINQASARAKQMHVDAMKELTGGISLPGMDDLIDQYTAGGDDQPPEPGQ
jgi:DNA-binding YbaB/EbfC family protein